MRIYSVKLNGSHFIIPSDRVRQSQSLITQAMRTHHPHTKGEKRRMMLHNASTSELSVVGGVGSVQIKDFQLG